MGGRFAPHARVDLRQLFTSDPPAQGGARGGFLPAVFGPSAEVARPRRPNGGGVRASHRRLRKRQQYGRHCHHLPMRLPRPPLLSRSIPLEYGRGQAIHDQARRTLSATLKRSRRDAGQLTELAVIAQTRGGADYRAQRRHWQRRARGRGRVGLGKSDCTAAATRCSGLLWRSRPPPERVRIQGRRRCRASSTSMK